MRLTDLIRNRHIARVAIWLLACVVFLWAAPGAEARRWGKDYLPNVPVVTQDGKTLRFYDDVIKGKIVVINFLYTTCRDICPLTAARLAQVQERFGPKMGKDIFFVSISIDPETDTPALLKAQADALKAGPGWLFLTGKPEHINQVRYKLGERSRSLDEHRNEVLLGNDRTGEWARESVFGDMERFIMSLRQLDPSLEDGSSAHASSDLSKVIAEINNKTPGQALYRRACAACHTIGEGNKIGPDLFRITERRDPAWVKRFMVDPDRLRRERDPIALELMAQQPGIRMPNLGLSRTDAEDLLAYIAATSEKVAHEPARKEPRPGPAERPLESLFALTTHLGKRLSAQDLAGKPVGVVFGFTRCPDVCPTTLLDWSNLLQSLGPDGDRIRLIFVSVDERDSPEALRAYLQSFDPRILALSGSAQDIAAAASAFDAFYEKIDNGGDYAYDHTIKTFLFDKDGRRAGAVDLNTAHIDRRQLLSKLLH